MSGCRRQPIRYFHAPMSDPIDNTPDDAHREDADQAVAQMKAGLGRARRLLDNTRQTLSGAPPAGEDEPAS